MPTPLSFEKKKEIYETAKANPGISKRKLGKLVGVSPETAANHRDTPPVPPIEMRLEEPESVPEQILHLRAKLGERSFRLVSCPGETETLSFAKGGR